MKKPIFVSDNFVHEAIDCAVGAGINVDQLLLNHNIDVDDLSVENFGRLWLAISQSMEDEYFGFGKSAMRPGSFSLMGYATFSAQNLDAALRRCLRFLKVILVEPYAETLIKNNQVQIVMRGDNVNLTPFAYRAFWLIIHGLSCWLIGKRIPLQIVEFSCPAPEDNNDYHYFFGVPTRFDAPITRIAFDVSYLRTPIARSEASLKKFLRGAPANLLTGFKHDEGMSAIVSNHLQSIMPIDWPTFNELARHLETNPSSLHRKLKLQNTDYRTIKNELRRYRARTLLIEKKLPVAEVAFQCGYNEPSAFHRAFKKWENMSPRRYRELHLSVDD